MQAVPASGRRVKFAEWDLFRVRDGNIVEITQHCDLFTHHVPNWRAAHCSARATGRVRMSVRHAASPWLPALPWPSPCSSGVSPAAATSSLRRAVDAGRAPGLRVGRGHDIPGYLASHRAPLEEFGFSSFGALASYAAAQDPNSCPPDL